MSRKKIIFVVPDGTGIRNYLFSQIIPNLLKQNVELLIYHGLSDDAILEVEKLHNVKLVKKTLSKYKETFLQKFYREAICYARLNYNTSIENNPTILTNWKRNFKGVKKWFYKLIEVFGKQISSDYSKILRLEEKYQKLLKESIHAEIEFLKQFKPDVLFCTHQRAINAIPVFKAADVLGIHTVGAIYSWDNLVKARLSIRTKKYIVCLLYTSPSPRDA